MEIRSVRLQQIFVKKRDGVVTYRCVILSYRIEISTSQGNTMVTPPGRLLMLGKLRFFFDVNFPDRSWMIEVSPFRSGIGGCQTIFTTVG